jgi:hypothetical protein
MEGVFSLASFYENGNVLPNIYSFEKVFFFVDYQSPLVKNKLVSVIDYSVFLI